MVNRPPGGGFQGALNRMRGKDYRPDEETLGDLLWRIAQTDDGDRFLTWVHNQTLGVSLPDDAPDGALRADAARKKFATTIFNLVERGRSKWQTAKASQK